MLEQLRHLRTAVDGLGQNIRDLRHRVSSLDGQVGRLQGEVASLRVDLATHAVRFDRIERRLELAPA